MEIKNENIRKLLEKVGKNPELQAKMSKFSSPEEAYELAASVQEGFTKDEFVAEMKRLYAESTTDLSDDDLAKAAGGTYQPQSLFATGVMSGGQITLSMSLNLTISDKH